MNREAIIKAARIKGNEPYEKVIYVMRGKKYGDQYAVVFANGCVVRLGPQKVGDVFEEI